MLALNDESAVRFGWRELERRVQAAGREWIGAIVQCMVAPGGDVLVGAVRDPDLGPVLGVGFGGRRAGLDRTAAFRLLPVTDAEADELIDSAEGVATELDGFRGSAALDRQALRELMLRFALLLREVPEVVETDLNPVRCMTSGCVVLDMRLRIEHRRPSSASRSGNARHQYDQRKHVTSVVITSAARTAIGSFGRSLRDVPPTELGATVARAAIERAGLEPEQVEQVVFGNVIHTSPEDMYMARVVGIGAGIPKEAPAFTVNRLCGSGVQAIVSAAQAIQAGDADVALAGGAESMSRGAYWMENARWGARMGDASLVDAVVGCLTDPFNQIHMGVTAENVAESHGVSREAQDEFALESHRRAQVAIEAGLFDEEVVPIEVKARKGTCRVQG